MCITTIIVYLLFCLNYREVSSQPGSSPAHCSDQLHNYYVDRGLSPGYPIIPVILYTIGNTTSDIPYVIATYNFQSAAQKYALNLTGGNTTNIPYSSYMSFDIPWCATDIIIQCANETIYAMGKICDNIVDYDLGTPNIVAGRFFVYANQTAACNGTVNVTYMNTTLYNTSYTSHYVYDAHGFINYTILSEEDAIYQYRYGGCEYSDGNNATFIDDYQRQFTCVDQYIGCSGNRLTTAPARQVVPSPRYACYNNTVTYDVNGTPTVLSQYMVWFVYNFQATGTPEGLFRVDFVNRQTLSSFYNGIYSPFNEIRCGWIAFVNFFVRIWTFFLAHIYEGPCEKQVLRPSTRRIFKADNLDFSSVMLINSGSGKSENWQTTVIPARFFLSGDPVIQIIPCICFFSMDCKADGTIDVDNINHHIDPNNKKPIARIFGVNPLIIPAGTPNISLNANRSTDPDNTPYDLTYFWKCYNISHYKVSPTTGIPLINIENVTAKETVAYTGNLIPGFYMIILYVSDGQDLAITILNFTVLDNIITAVAPNDFVAYLYPCSATSQPECIPLDANLSRQTANYTLYYNWTEVTGSWSIWPITFSSVCNNYTRGLFNYNQSLGCFVPPFYGLYHFKVTVYDNFTASSTDDVWINVVPPGGNLTFPNETLGTFPPSPFQTNPPIYRPIILFPTTPDIPYTDPPNLLPTSPSSTTSPSANNTPAPTEVNTSVPALFPTYPPTTNSQAISMFAVLCAGVLITVIFFGLYMVMMADDDYNFLDRIRYFVI